MQLTFWFSFGPPIQASPSCSSSHRRLVSRWLRQASTSSTLRLKTSAMLCEWNSKNICRTFSLLSVLIAAILSFCASLRPCQTLKLFWMLQSKCSCSYMLRKVYHCRLSNPFPISVWKAIRLKREICWIHSLRSDSAEKLTRLKRRINLDVGGCVTKVCSSSYQSSRPIWLWTEISFH